MSENKNYRASKAEQAEAPNYLENIYGFLCSIAPEGIADEAFRLVPDSVLPYSTRHRIAGSRPAVGDMPSAVSELPRPPEGPVGRVGEPVTTQPTASSAGERELLKDIGLLLHHFWCDVQMNDYSFQKLNAMMVRIDAARARGEKGANG